MQSITRFRHAILFLSGITSLFILAACADPVTTEKVLEDMGNGVCQQLPSRLMWQIKESPKFSTWQEAKDYADSLELGGFDDWRLPTREECLFLAELLEITKGDCPITFSKAHWVSKESRKNPGHWESYPLCGGSELRWVKGKNGSVRAVRP